MLDQLNEIQKDYLLTSCDVICSKILKLMKNQQQTQRKVRKITRNKKQTKQAGEYKKKCLWCGHFARSKITQ